LGIKTRIMKNKIGQIELEWVKEENKHYAYFNNNQGIVFAPTQKEAKRLAALYDSADSLFKIVKQCHVYGGGALDLERAELINKLK